MTLIETTVVNVYTTPFDVKIDRTTPFGNPFILGKDGDRTTVLSKFRAYFEKRVNEDAFFRRQVLTLRGKRLGCVCSPKLCHGMIIVEWLEANAA